MNRRTIPLIMAVLACEACSSRPREFTPQLQSPPADAVAYQSARDRCDPDAIDARLKQGDRLASGGAGVAAGAATAAVGSAAAGSSATMAGGMAAAGATIVALPFVAVLGAWGLAKSKKLKKEKHIKTAVAECLQEQGYQVAGWERTPKGKRKPRRFSQRDTR